MTADTIYPFTALHTQYHLVRLSFYTTHYYTLYYTILSTHHYYTILYITLYNQFLVMNEKMNAYMYNELTVHAYKLYIYIHI